MSHSHDRPAWFESVGSTVVPLGLYWIDPISPQQRQLPAGIAPARSTRIIQ
jgi:hypothetical protein